MLFKLPTKDSIVENRWVKWIGPSLLHPGIWKWKRHSVSLGVAIGLFFGFLIPLAQIPLSAIFAVFLRANLTVAAVSTLVTNPFTFPGIYYVAYQFGSYVLNLAGIDQAQVSTLGSSGWLDSIFSTGKPLMVGLCIFAVVFGFCGYFITSFVWNIRIRLKWVRRARLRQNA